MLISNANDQNVISRYAAKLKAAYGSLHKQIAFNENQQIDFMLELGTWLKDNVKPVDALTGMSRCYELLGKENTVPAQACESMLASLRQGKTISDGMKGYFNSYLLTVFKAAEESGTVNESLLMLKEDRESMKQLKGIVTKKVTPPVIYLVMLLLSSVTLVKEVLPSLAKGKSFGMNVEEWPIPAGGYYNLMTALGDYWFILFIVVILAWVAVSRFLKNNVSDFRMELDQLPGFNIYRILASNAFLKTLSILLKSHIPVRRSLEIIEENSSNYVGHHAKMAQIELGKGNGELGVILDTGLIRGDALVKMGYLTNSPSQEAKVEGLRLTAQRSIEMAQRNVQVSALVLAALGWLCVVTLLILNAASIMVLSFSR